MMFQCLQDVQMHRLSVMFTSVYVYDSREVYGYRQRAKSKRMRQRRKREDRDLSNNSSFNLRTFLGGGQLNK